MELSKAVYDMMVLRRMTIKDISEKSGLSKNQIGLVLRGVYTRKSMGLVQGLARALQCTPGWLLRK